MLDVNACFCLQVQEAVPDSVQEAEAVPAPVEERHGPDEGKSRRTGREILGLPRPFQQELKVRGKDCIHMDLESS